MMDCVFLSDAAFLPNYVHTHTFAHSLPRSEWVFITALLQAEKASHLALS